MKQICLIKSKYNLQAFSFFNLSHVCVISQGKVLIIFNNSNCGKLTDVLEETHNQACLPHFMLYLAKFYSCANFLGNYEAIRNPLIHFINSLEDILRVKEIK